MEAGGLLTAGGVALAAGDWVAARDAFGELVGRGETAEGLAGLGTAHWWLGDIREAFSWPPLRRERRKPCRGKRLGRAGSSTC